jgi:hypothetical protein
MIALNLWAAWIGILAGMVSGAAFGIFFHEESWLGGYGSWPRRLMRLGHISFFGVAFLNLAFAVTLRLTGDVSGARAASWLLIAGAVLMPTVCGLAAWRKPLRHLFFLPVLSLLGAAVAMIHGGLS